MGGKGGVWVRTGRARVAQQHYWLTGWGLPSACRRGTRSETFRARGAVWGQDGAGRPQLATPHGGSLTDPAGTQDSGGCCQYGTVLLDT